jgi:predicted RNA-binding protein with PUA-like domain
LINVDVLFIFSSSEKDNPKWFMVDVKFVRMLKRFIPLSELKSIHLQHKADGGPLENMALFTRARLSVQPVTKGRCSKLGCTKV